MNEFKKYQHIERLGSDEVEGILLGNTYIFPKLDGSNGSVWMENGEICTGSRNRKLTLDNDNQGFFAYIKEHQGINIFLEEFPNATLHGEWLVPHTLKTYRDSAWRHFYVFDVMVEGNYQPYEHYKELLDEYDIPYIPALACISYPSLDQLNKILESNTYLIEDGKGSGEGIVIKNYNYKSRYDRITWAKIVRNEFKEKHGHLSETPEWTNSMPEKDMVESFLTEEMIKKSYAKANQDNPPRAKLIPRLLETVYHDFLVEEIWKIAKALKRQTLNFKILRHFVNLKVKKILKEVF